MTHFEYVLAIPAVVVALAMSELLLGWGRLLRAESAPKVDYLFAGWSLFFLMSGPFLWLGNWDYGMHDKLSSGLVFSMLLPPLFLFPISVMFSPVLSEDGTISMRDQYFRVAPKAFPLAFLYFVSASLADYVVIEESVAPGGVISTLFGLPLLLLAWFKIVPLHIVVLTLYLLFQFFLVFAS